MRYLIVGVAVFVVAFALVSLLLWLGTTSWIALAAAAVVGLAGSVLIRSRFT